MNPPPAFLALSTKLGSIWEKTKSEISGMFDLKGKILDPAGRIASVEMLSPSLISTLPTSFSGRGLARGRGLMFGPRWISAPAALAGGGGHSRLATRNFTGQSVTGHSPSSR